MNSVYPESGRSAWIAAQRPPREKAPDPFQPHGVFLERERLATGEIADSGVVLLTNRECPWRCLMCDLWKGTTTTTVPPGAIPAQVAGAVRRWREQGGLPVQVKLYNSGSFFDPAAIPDEDYEPIAREVSFARRVVVESHPKLIGERTRRLQALLAGSLEVAMGLETAHPQSLASLNKGFDTEQFASAARALARDGIGLRVFLLVNPPFLQGRESGEWVVRSAEFAFDHGATAVTLIPTRTGNGALDRLAAAGEFVEPTLGELESAQDAILALRRGRVFADTWDLERFKTCPVCFGERRQRIEGSNLAQEQLPKVRCPRCARERN